MAKPVAIEQIIINKTDKPNSLEKGSSGNRFKIYYNNPEDLKKHLEELKKLGLYKDE